MIVLRLITNKATIMAQLNTDDNLRHHESWDPYWVKLALNDTGTICLQGNLHYDRKNPSCVALRFAIRNFDFYKLREALNKVEEERLVELTIEQSQGRLVTTRRYLAFYAIGARIKITIMNQRAFFAIPSDCSLLADIAQFEGANQ